MHRVSSTHFGWSRDNTIGATPQTNTPNGDWIAFWREQRLGFQLELAARKGLVPPTDAGKKTVTGA